MTSLVLNGISRGAAESEFELDESVETFLCMTARYKRKLSMKDVSEAAMRSSVPPPEVAAAAETDAKRPQMLCSGSDGCLRGRSKSAEAAGN